MAVGIQRHIPTVLPPGKNPVPIVQEAGWELGPVWSGAENLVHHRDSIAGPSSRSESLYRLSYPGPLSKNITYFNSFNPYPANVENRVSS